MKRVLFALFAALCAVILLSGCTKIKTMGGEEAKVKYKRIVSLSPSSSEIAALIPFCEVIGKTAACDWPPTLKGVVVMKGVKPDYETIIKMGPDAIFYDSTIIPKADLAKFETAGIPLVDTDGGPKLEDFERALRELGPYTHGEYVLSTYIDQIWRSVAQANVSAMDPKPKVAVVLPSAGNGEHMIAGLDTFAAMVVNNSGGEFVGPSGRMYVPLNAEEFIKMNPDVIIVAGETQSVVGDPRFKTMTAIQKKRISGYAPGVLLRKGQRVNLAIKNMAAMIIEQMKKE
jgi:iron complex transport system substrate-binding protein